MLLKIRDPLTHGIVFNFGKFNTVNCLHSNFVNLPNNVLHGFLFCLPSPLVSVFLMDFWPECHRSEAVPSSGCHVWRTTVSIHLSLVIWLLIALSRCCPISPLPRCALSCQEGPQSRAGFGWRGLVSLDGLGTLLTQPQLVFPMQLVSLATSKQLRRQFKTRQAERS